MEPGRLDHKITTIWNKNFICVMIVNFMLCFAHSSVNPLVATYTKFLGTSVHITGLLTGMFFGISLAMRPVAGPMTTKLDKRKLLIFVFALGSVACAGYAVFHSVAGFVTFRFLNGVQYSLVGSLMMTLASDNLPLEKLASGMGIYGIGGAIGNAVAPAVSSVILERGTAAVSEGFGFTLVFSFTAVILALAIIPSILVSPDRKTRAEIQSTGTWYKNIFTANTAPMTIVLLLVMMSYSLYGTYIIEFGVKELGLAKEKISVFYTVLALSMAVSRPISGLLTDRLGAPRVMYPAITLFAASFITIGVGRSFTATIIGAVLAAIGFGAAQPTLQAMCLQTEAGIMRGVATNTIYIGVDLAMFIGPIFGSIVYGMSSYAVMFEFGAVPLLIAMVYFTAVLPGYRRRIAELKAQ